MQILSKGLCSNILIEAFQRFQGKCTHFIPPEQTYGFLVFSGVSNGNIRQKRIKNFLRYRDK